MQLSIIIVSYNTAELTVQTVQSVVAAIAPESSLQRNYELIVVDNDSHDDTVARLQALKLKNLKVIEAHANLGFGRANNLGFKQATGQYILFLNSDTIVPAGTLEKLVDFYRERQTQEKDKKKKLGLLAAGLRNRDGTPQPQGGDLPNLATIAASQLFLDDIPIVGRLIPSVQHTGRRFDPKVVARFPFYQIGWVAGTAVICHRDVWTDHGGWDENIFMYGEDQEVCYRLHQEKYYHGILHTAPITHMGSASSSSAFAILGEINGYLYFFRRHKSREQWDWLKLLLWLACWLRITVFTFIKKDPKRAEIYTQAIEVVEKATYE